MEQLCRRINMPEEMTRRLLEIHSTLEYFPCLSLLMQESTWAEGLQQLKQDLGDNAGDCKRLCCMLRCALRTKEIYDRLGISEKIYIDTMNRMFTPVWRYDPARKNGDTYLGMMNCYGMGPHIFTNTPMGDRIPADRELPFSGLTADAYGLLGGMLFDRKHAKGMVSVVAGTGSDKNQYFGSYSSFYRWEEDWLTAAGDFARYPY